MTLTWDPVPGATSYNVYWSTSPGVTIADGHEDRRLVESTLEADVGRADDAAELQAAPEYFNQGAYAMLFAASYPFSPPVQRRARRAPHLRPANSACRSGRCD